MASRAEFRGEARGVILPGKKPGETVIVPGFKGDCRLSSATLEQHFSEYDGLMLLSPNASIVFDKVSKAVFDALDACQSQGLPKTDKKRALSRVVTEVCDRFLIGSGKSLSRVPKCTLEYNRAHQTLVIKTKPKSSDERFLLQAEKRNLMSDTEELLKKVSEQRKAIELSSNQSIGLRNIPFSGTEWQDAPRAEFSVPDQKARLVIKALGEGILQVQKAQNVPFCKTKDCLVLKSATGMVISVEEPEAEKTEDKDN